MRAADALEKVCRARPAMMQPHVAVLLGAISAIRPGSTDGEATGPRGRPLREYLHRYENSNYKSLANRAGKLLTEFG